jgi:hypothetical protein
LKLANPLASVWLLLSTAPFPVMSMPVELLAEEVEDWMTTESLITRMPTPLLDAENDLIVSAFPVTRMPFAGFPEAVEDWIDSETPATSRPWL